MDTDSFIIHIKTEKFSWRYFKRHWKIVCTLNYSGNDKRPLSSGMNKKVIGLVKDELGGKIMIEFALKPKTYFYLIDDGSEHKMCIMKREIKFENQKCKNETILKTHQKFKIEAHGVYTE